MHAEEREPASSMSAVEAEGREAHASWQAELVETELVRAARGLVTEHDADGISERGIHELEAAFDDLRRFERREGGA